MCIQVFVEVVAYADFVRIYIITDTYGTESRNLISYGNLSFQADLSAVIMVSVTGHLRIDTSYAAESGDVRVNMVNTSNGMFVYTVTVMACFRIVVIVLQVYLVIQDIGYVAAGKMSLCISMTHFLIKTVVYIDFKIALLAVLNGSTCCIYHGTGRYESSQQGRCNYLFHNSAPPKNQVHLYNLSDITCIIRDFSENFNYRYEHKIVSAASTTCFTVITLMPLYFPSRIIFFMLFPVTYSCVDSRTTALSV